MLYKEPVHVCPVAYMQLVYNGLTNQVLARDVKFLWYMEQLPVPPVIEARTKVK